MALGPPRMSPANLTTRMSRPNHLSWRKRLSRQNHLFWHKRLFWRKRLSRRERLSRQNHLFWRKRLSRRERLSRRRRLSWENQRSNIVLGFGITIFPIVAIMLIGAFRNTTSMTSPAPVRAQALERPELLSDTDAGVDGVVDVDADVDADSVNAPVRNAEDAPETSLDASVDASPISADAAPSIEQCKVSGVPLGYGSFGDDVFCLQFVLAKIELFASEQNGLFDDATVAAVSSFQSLQNLFVDGVVGRKTGMKLGIWPLDPFTVERTPVPPPGAVDLWGLPLSSVAVSGPDAPPLPANSGSGYRLVYDRAAQRVWAVDENETVIRSWLVSGSRESNEIPGVHKVYSRSKTSVSRDGESSFSYMVRWLRTRNDAIGFHSLPQRTLDDSLYQTEEELGIRLSSGCQRQAELDAQFTWQFAEVGTTVVVL